MSSNERYPRRNGIAYLRVSTDGQAGEDRFGLLAQREAIQDYCGIHRIDIIEWLVDDGVSGASSDRPALGRVMRGEIPGAEVLVVAKQDRLARKVELFYTFTHMLGKVGLKVISADLPVSQEGGIADAVMTSIFATLAEVERILIRDRTAGGRAMKSKQGGYSGGGAPLGYMAKDKSLVVVPEEAEVVRLAFELKATGRTDKSIADTLNARGYSTRTGAKFLQSTVQRLWAREPFYRGQYKYGKGEWVEGQHEAIL